MQVNVNCQYNNDRYRCKNERVRRSLFGLGPRICIDYPREQGCQYRIEYQRPDPPKGYSGEKIAK